MKGKLGLLLIPLLLAILALGAAGCSTTTAAGDSPNLQYVGGSQQNVGIWVNGVGKVTVTPDIATLNIGVEYQLPTVGEAQAQAAQTMTAVLAAVKALGVADKDITTRAYNVYPVYSYGKPTDPMTPATQTIVGYRVTNTVQVKVRKVDDTGKVIDAAAAAAGDALRVNSIAFSVDQPEKYYDQARSLAMADAEAKAKQLASLGHVKLGAPTYISENTGYIQPIYYGADSSLGAGREAVPTVPTPVSPGETEVQINVQVVYSIS